MLVFLSNIEEGGSRYVQLGPQLEPLDNLEGFLGSLRFEHRRKLDQSGIEIDPFDETIRKFGG
jgi:hypothetical protein